MVRAYSWHSGPVYFCWIQTRFFFLYTRGIRRRKKKIFLSTVYIKMARTMHLWVYSVVRFRLIEMCKMIGLQAYNLIQCFQFISRCVISIYWTTKQNLITALRSCIRLAPVSDYKPSRSYAITKWCQSVRAPSLAYIWSQASSKIVNSELCISALRNSGGLTPYNGIHRKVKTNFILPEIGVRSTMIGVIERAKIPYWARLNI